MCDASDYAVGAVLGKRVDKKLNVIHYASKTLDTAQRNYATTEKEFLAVVFACDKLDLILLIPKLLFTLIMLLLNILWKRKMLSLDSLDGFSCSKNLTCILLIERELRTTLQTTCIG